MSRLDALNALRRPGDGRDYSDGGEVETALLSFLSDSSGEWFLRSRLAYRLEVDLARLETVLNRLLRKGRVKLRVDEWGHTQWRGN